jgi:hypothetical protein
MIPQLDPFGRPSKTLFFMVLHNRLAHIKVVGGEIVHAFAIEREPWSPHRPERRLHWAEGVGSWEAI